MAVLLEFTTWDDTPIAIDADLVVSIEPFDFVKDDNIVSLGVKGRPGSLMVRGTYQEVLRKVKAARRRSIERKS